MSIEVVEVIEARTRLRRSLLRLDTAAHKSLVAAGVDVEEVIAGLGDRLEQRAAVVGRGLLRDHALLALGVCFGLGLLLSRTTR